YRRTQLFERLNYKTLALHNFKMFERSFEKRQDRGIKKTAKILSSIYDSLGTLYASYEMDDLAIEYKFKAIISAPDESRLYYNLGAYLVKNKEYRLGIHYLEEAIKIHPKHGFAHWLLGIAYSDLDMPELALEKIQVAFQREEGIKKRNTGRSERDLLTTRGYIYHQLGDDNSAIEDLDKALDVNDKNSYAYRNLGVIYYKQGDFDAACANFSLAKELHYTQNHDQYDIETYTDKSCTVKGENEPLPTTISQLPFVWPNPATTFIKIENYAYENFPYTILDYNGKTVQEGVADGKKINIEYLTQGTYMLRITVAEAPQNFKIIKIHN
ncbi:MAG: T9SS type A sorting domain-containing protein, partial [Flavicella sp.]